MDEKETEKLDEQMWGSDEEEEGSDSEVRVELIPLTLYPIEMPLRPFKNNVFENIMKNGAFALLGQMLYFP